jgi:hypothetical protein
VSAHFTRGFVDAIYAKLLVVKEEDADGKTVGASADVSQTPR